MDNNNNNQIKPPPPNSLFNRLPPMTNNNNNPNVQFYQQNLINTTIIQPNNKSKNIIPQNNNNNNNNNMPFYNPNMNVSSNVYQQIFSRSNYQTGQRSSIYSQNYNNNNFEVPSVLKKNLTLRQYSCEISKGTHGGDIVIQRDNSLVYVYGGYQNRKVQGKKGRILRCKKKECKRRLHIIFRESGEKFTLDCECFFSGGHSCSERQTLKIHEMKILGASTKVYPEIPLKIKWTMSGISSVNSNLKKGLKVFFVQVGDRVGNQMTQAKVNSCNLVHPNYSLNCEIPVLNFPSGCEVKVMLEVEDSGIKERHVHKEPLIYYNSDEDYKYRHNNVVRKRKRKDAFGNFDDILRKPFQRYQNSNIITVKHVNPERGSVNGGDIISVFFNLKNIEIRNNIAFETDVPNPLNDEFDGFFVMNEMGSMMNSQNPQNSMKKYNILCVKPCLSPSVETYIQKIKNRFSNSSKLNDFESARYFALCSTIGVDRPGLVDVYLRSTTTKQMHYLQNGYEFVANGNNEEERNSEVIFDENEKEDDVGGDDIFGDIFGDDDSTDYSQFLNEEDDNAYDGDVNYIDFLRNVCRGDLDGARRILGNSNDLYALLKRKDWMGNTCLHWAEYFERSRIVEFLIKNDVNQKALNEWKMTPKEFHTYRMAQYKKYIKKNKNILLHVGLMNRIVSFLNEDEKFDFCLSSKTVWKNIMTNMIYSVYGDESNTFNRISQLSHRMRKCDKDIVLVVEIARDTYLHFGKFYREEKLFKNFRFIQSEYDWDQSQTILNALNIKGMKRDAKKLYSLVHLVGMSSLMSRKFGSGGSKLLDSEERNLLLKGQKRSMLDDVVTSTVTSSIVPLEPLMKAIKSIGSVSVGENVATGLMSKGKTSFVSPILSDVVNQRKMDGSALFKNFSSGNEGYFAQPGLMMPSLSAGVEVTKNLYKWINGSISLKQAGKDTLSSSLSIAAGWFGMKGGSVIGSYFFPVVGDIVGGLLGYYSMFIITNSANKIFLDKVIEDDIDKMFNLFKSCYVNISRRCNFDEEDIKKISDNLQKIYNLKDVMGDMIKGKDDKERVKIARKVLYDSMRNIYEEALEFDREERGLGMKQRRDAIFLRDVDVNYITDEYDNS